MIVGVRYADYTLGVVCVMLVLLCG